MPGGDVAGGGGGEQGWIRRDANTPEVEAVGFKIIDPAVDIGFDIAAEYEEARRMYGGKQRGSRAGRGTAFGADPSRLLVEAICRDLFHVDRSLQNGGGGVRIERLEHW